MSGGGRERERERERKSARKRERKRGRKHFGSSFFMFFPPLGPALCKLGLARSAVCSIWNLHSGPWTFFCSIFAGFSLPCLLATTILDSFSLFYLPNTWKTIGTRRTLWTYLYPSMQEINISYDVYPPCVTRLVRGVCINRERKFRAQKSVSTNFVTSPLIYSPSLSFA